MGHPVHYTMNIAVWLLQLNNWRHTFGHA